MAWGEKPTRGQGQVSLAASTSYKGAFSAHSKGHVQPEVSLDQEFEFFIARPWTISSSVMPARHLRNGAASQIAHEWDGGGYYRGRGFSF